LIGTIFGSFHSDIAPRPVQLTMTLSLRASTADLLANFRCLNTTPRTRRSDSSRARKIGGSINSV